jgi:hypothetical protein
MYIFLMGAAGILKISWKKSWKKPEWWGEAGRWGGLFADRQALPLSFLRRRL